MLSGAAVPLQDPAQLQARLAAVMAFLEDQTSTVEQLRAERDSLRAERDTAAAEIDKLRLMIRQLLRAQYGRRSETLDPDQLQLGLEEVEQSLATAQASAPVATKTPGQRRPAQRNRGALPPHLPRYEVIVDIDDKSCPCCGGPLHVIGEDVSEMLDVVPA
jgi:transposase